MRLRGREALTGPMSVRAVSSRTFSMAEREGSMGGGRTKVALGILAAEDQGVVTTNRLGTMS